MRVAAHSYHQLRRDREGRGVGRERERERKREREREIAKGCVRMRASEEREHPRFLWGCMHVCVCVHVCACCCACWVIETFSGSTNDYTAAMGDGGGGDARLDGSVTLSCL